MMAIDASRKLPATALTAICLLMGVMTRITEDVLERWVLFCVSTFMFAVVGHIVLDSVQRYQSLHPSGGDPDLQRALRTMIIVWPVFPVAWIFGAHANVASAERTRSQPLPPPNARGGRPR